MRGSPDVDIARWIADHRIAPLTHAFHWMEAVGESPLLAVGIAVAVLVVVAIHRLWWAIPRIALAIWIVLVAEGNLKPRINRPRPPADLAASVLSGPSMPSAHAAISSVVVAAILLTPWWTSQRLHRVAIVVGVGGCVLTGVAMIYLGGHWLSDVLAGWILGVGAAALVIRALPRRRRNAGVMAEAPGRTSPASPPQER